MAYREFTTDRLKADLGLELSASRLFPDLKAEVVSDWLWETIARGLRNGLQLEKARSVFVMAPVTLSLQDLLNNRFSVLSGAPLNVDSSRNLTGDCDFILTPHTPIPVLMAPLMTIVEAKRRISTPVFLSVPPRCSRPGSTTKKRNPLRGPSSVASPGSGFGAGRSEKLR